MIVNQWMVHTSRRLGTGRLPENWTSALLPLFVSPPLLFFPLWVLAQRTNNQLSRYLQ
jgi:hypothetical protein